jgi:uncharacterized protein YqjF (DUF2071 family)
VIGWDEREAQRERPSGRPAGFQRWRDLAFLHWSVDPAAVAALLPAELSVDTWEDRAWIGVVPFAMRDVSPWWSPSVPGISNFLELNVRTYVHREGRVPGVWFFSLDAAKAIAVLLARTGWDLPYHFARMTSSAGPASRQLEREGDEVTYASERLYPGPTPAKLALRYAIGEAIGEARSGTFEHFLAERYVLYAQGKQGLRLGRVHHSPYPLHRAEVRAVEESMVVAAGLPAPEGAPHILYSPGVDVDVFALEPIR